MDEFYVNTNEVDAGSSAYRIKSEVNEEEISGVTVQLTLGIKRSELPNQSSAAETSKELESSEESDTSHEAESEDSGAAVTNEYYRTDTNGAEINPETHTHKKESYQADADDINVDIKLEPNRGSFEGISEEDEIPDSEIDNILSILPDTSKNETKTSVIFKKAKTSYIYEDEGYTLGNHHEPLCGTHDKNESLKADSNKLESSGLETEKETGESDTDDDTVKFNRSKICRNQSDQADSDTESDKEHTKWFETKTNDILETNEVSFDADPNEVEHCDSKFESDQEDANEGRVDAYTNESYQADDESSEAEDDVANVEKDRKQINTESRYSASEFHEVDLEEGNAEIKIIVTAEDKNRTKSSGSISRQNSSAISNNNDVVTTQPEVITFRTNLRTQDKFYLPSKRITSKIYELDEDEISERSSEAGAYGCKERCEDACLNVCCDIRCVRWLGLKYLRCIDRCCSSD